MNNLIEYLIFWLTVITEAIMFTVLIAFMSIMFYRSLIQPLFIMLLMWYISIGCVFLAKRILTDIRDKFDCYYNND
jgi:hypothetical protein